MTLHPLVATAPTPHLAIDSTQAVISRVRFLHRTRCGACRRTYPVATDGGTITTGIRHTHGNAKWFTTRTPGGRPTAPDRCPHCDREQRGTPLWGEPCEVVYARRLLDEAHEHLRATHPDLAAEADRNTGRT